MIEHCTRDDVAVLFNPPRQQHSTCVHASPNKSGGSKKQKRGGPGTRHTGGPGDNGVFDDIDDYEPEDQHDQDHEQDTFLVRSNQTS